MLEFFIFWGFIVLLCSALVYVSYQHYQICKIRKRVDKDWLKMSETVDRLDQKLKSLQESMMQSENRLEDIRQDQITTKKEADEVSLSVHKSFEDLVKKQKPLPLDMTIKAGKNIGVLNPKPKKSNKTIKMSIDKKKSK